MHRDGHRDQWLLCRLIVSVEEQPGRGLRVRSVGTAGGQVGGSACPLTESSFLSWAPQANQKPPRDSKKSGS